MIQGSSPYIPPEQPHFEEVHGSNKKGQGAKVEKGQLQKNADVLYTYDISDITVNVETGDLYKSNLGFFEGIAAKIKDWFNGGKVEQFKNDKIRETLHAIGTDIKSVDKVGVQDAALDDNRVKELGVKILFNGNFSEEEINSEIDRLQLKDTIALDNEEIVTVNPEETFVVNNEGKLEIASMKDKIVGFFTGYSAKVQKFIVDLIKHPHTPLSSPPLRNVKEGDEDAKRAALFSKYRPVSTPPPQQIMRNQEASPVPPPLSKQPSVTDLPAIPTAMQEPEPEPISEPQKGAKGGNVGSIPDAAGPEPINPPQK